MRRSPPDRSNFSQCLATILAITLIGTSSIANSEPTDLGICVDAEFYLRNSAELLVESCRRAAEVGNVSAQFRLGWLYNRADFISERVNLASYGDAAAAEWYRKAADQGSAEAAAYLGSLYHFGFGVPQSDEMALKYTTIAAEKGYGPAQHDLGVLYSSNPSSQEIATAWYRRAAEQGNGFSQAFLGYLYYSGKGVDQSDSEAEKWWLKAADQDVAEAQFNLGQFYRLADNPDLIKALAWYGLAAVDRYPSADEQAEELRSKMTRAEILQSANMQEDLAKRIDSLRIPRTIIDDVEDCARADMLAVADPDLAAGACLRLAEHGNPAAQISVAHMYATGIYFRADLVRAFAWGTISADSPPDDPAHEIALLLVEWIKAQLTEDQVNVGRRLAAGLKTTLDR